MIATIFPDDLWRKETALGLSYRLIRSIDRDQVTYQLSDGTEHTITRQGFVHWLVKAPVPVLLARNPRYTLAAQSMRAEAA